jgi:hypothetical protein
MITTQRDMIRNIAKRWRTQYSPMEKWDNRPTTFGHPATIAEKLDQLDGDTATPADVEAITGNDSWTRLTCNQCGKNCLSVFTFYTLELAETQSFDVCAQCLSAAALQLPNMPV